MKYTKTISSLIVAGAFIVNSSLMAVDEDKKPAGKQFHAKLKDIYSEEQLKEFYEKAEAAKKGKGKKGKKK